MPFKSGNKLATGGHRANAGRKPDWLKDKCQAIIKDKKLIEFLADVAAGEPFIEKFAIVDSKTTPIEKMRQSADVKDRLKAVEMLLDRGFGKAIQVLSGDPDNPPILLFHADGKPA